MRKGQRFTPVRLRRWQESGRGTGALGDYQPWHQVTRADPSSRGRSHLVNGHYDRLHHLLSDAELEAFGFATMLPALDDLREQFRLPTEDGIAQDEIRHQPISAGWSEGTLSIARCLGFKHPVLRKGDDSEPWVMTTDLVLRLMMPNGAPELLAVSVKLSSELANARTLELLAIEREYWRRRGAQWLLLTEQLYEKSAGHAIRAGLLWSLGQPRATQRHLELCAGLKSELAGRTLQQALDCIQERIGVDHGTAQSILWQSVWRGGTPIDLTKPIRAAFTLEMLTPASFWQQNPIAARRTAWAR